MSLHPCTSCRRHVRADADACPFCGGPQTTRTVVSGVPAVGRISRAAVFAGLTACWTSSRSTEPAAPPPPPPATDAAVVTEAEPLLTGAVFEKGTQRAIYDAVVELRDANGKVAAVNTDMNGGYELDVPPGEYQLVVHVNDGSAVGSAQVPVSVRDSAQHLVVEVPLLRRAPIPKPYGAPPARRARIV